MSLRGSVGTALQSAGPELELRHPRDSKPLYNSRRLQTPSIPKPSLILAGLSGCFGFLGVVTLMAGLLVTAGASVEVGEDGQLEPLSPRDGYIRGRAITEDGRPLEKFTVEYAGFPKGALGTYDGNSNLTAPDQGQIDGANGKYAVKVGDGLYGASARVEVNYDGHLFRFDLASTNGKGMNDREEAGNGIVRDFVWKMSGARPGRDPNSNTESRMFAMHGGVVKIDMHSANEVQNRKQTVAPLRDASPGGDVDITLTPKGKVIDGSDGRVIVERFKTDQSGTIYAAMREIPIGVYTVTAKLGDGTPLRVSDKYSEQTDTVGIDHRFPGEASFELHFQPTESVTGGVKMVTLYVNR